MRISPLAIAQPPHFSAHFANTSAHGLRLKNPAQDQLWHDTEFFSPSSFFHQLLEQLKQLPPGTPIYSMACSTGEEPLSLAMILVSQFGREAASKYKITAVDIGKQAIEQAKSGVVTVNHTERRNADAALAGSSTGDNTLMSFLEPLTRRDYRPALRPRINNVTSETLQLQPWFANLVSQMVTFSVGDVRQVLSNNPIDSSKPCVFLFRNAWHYLPDKDRTTLLQQLKQQMAPGSIIGIGHLEHERSGEYATRERVSTAELIERAGFTPMSKKNATLFQKK
ncbi:MAG: hypothetical protein K2X01_10950 [Cyanobacteria bacterium]|nr:hypothetical protein [Cyanobacteriota bacterium]